MIDPTTLAFVFMIILLGCIGFAMIADKGRRLPMLAEQVHSLPGLVSGIEPQLVLDEVLALRGAMAAVGVSRAQLIGGQAWEVYLVDNDGNAVSVFQSTSLDTAQRLTHELSETLEVPIEDPDLLLASS